ncbi:unnamed protein product [Lupinus luteus]|uniref:Uncharacterized protein n=1 Tax=Lupinus luteus TaxID=3873 RepID=A0AAV1WK07_LUPLU
MLEYVRRSDYRLHAKQIRLKGKDDTIIIKGGRIFSLLLRKTIPLNEKQHISLLYYFEYEKENRRQRDSLRIGMLTIDSFFLGSYTEMKDLKEEEKATLTLKSSERCGIRVLLPTYSVRVWVYLLIVINMQNKSLFDLSLLVSPYRVRFMSTSLPLRSPNGTLTYSHALLIHLPGITAFFDGEAGNPLPKGGSLLVSSARSTASSPLFSEIDMLLTKTRKELLQLKLYMIGKMLRRFSSPIKESSIAVYLYVKAVKRLYRKSGGLFLALYLKQCASSLQIAYGGSRKGGPSRQPGGGNAAPVGGEVPTLGFKDPP